MLGSAVFRTGVAPGGALAGPWVRNPLWAASRAVPSLDLRFANNKSLVDATTGQNLVTFTRASNGTYVDSQGVIRTATTNEARFAHNPTTGESLGLLVEEQRTNLLLRSEEFGTTWLQSNTNISSDTGLSPSGLPVADKIIADTTNGQHFRRQDITVTASTSYSLSVYAKADGYNFLAISPGVFAVADYLTWFDLSTGTVGTNTAGNTASIQNVGNGWYRCSVTRTTNVVQTTMSSRYYICNADNVSSFVGDNTSGVLLWGAQLEAGAFPTSYIPTTAATATRSADVASISGSNFSSWYRQDTGSWYCSANSLVFDSSERGLFGIDTGSFARGYHASTNSPTRIRTRRRDATTSLAIDATSLAGTSARIALVATSTEQAATYNGGAIQANATALTLDPITDLRIGYQNITGATANLYLCGCVSRLTYWPQRLSNPVLQAITQ